MFSHVSFDLFCAFYMNCMFCQLLYVKLGSLMLLLIYFVYFILNCFKVSVCFVNYYV
jgi:hypothetical protein